MKTLNLKNMTALFFGLLIAAMPDLAANAQDIFSAIEEPGNEILDFVLGTMAPLISAFALVGYILYSLYKREFNLGQAAIIVLCCILLAEVQTIVDYLFN